MSVPNHIEGLIILKKFIPADFNAVISFFWDILPKVITLEINNDIGTERAIIQAKFKNRYSRMVSNSRPLPKNLSIARNKKLMNKTKVIINNEKIKGYINSFIKYLDKSLIAEITILCSILSFNNSL